MPQECLLVIQERTSVPQVCTLPSFMCHGKEMYLCATVANLCATGSICVIGAYLCATVANLCPRKYVCATGAYSCARGLYLCSTGAYLCAKGEPSFATGVYLSSKATIPKLKFQNSTSKSRDAKFKLLSYTSLKLKFGSRDCTRDF